MEAEKDVVAQDIPDGGEHGRPRTKRELDDRLEVALAELTDLNRTSRSRTRTVAACE